MSFTWGRKYINPCSPYSVQRNQHLGNTQGQGRLHLNTKKAGAQKNCSSAQIKHAPHAEHYHLRHDYLDDDVHVGVAYRRLPNRNVILLGNRFKQLLDDVILAVV